MLVLLAESKSMSSRQEEIAPKVFESHTPLLEEMADETMAYVASMPPLEIAERLGISAALATKSATMAYEFPNKSQGYPTLSAFTGDAFKGLQPSTLTSDALESAFSRLRIISSLYGILRPNDIIKQYRLEFNRPIAPNNLTPIKFLKPKITVEVVKYLKLNKIKDIINLLPADADACLDWKIIRAFTKVHKICFQTISPVGTLKTPQHRMLKELRGIMCREILENNLLSFTELCRFESRHFVFSPADSKPGLPVFISAR